MKLSKNRKYWAELAIQSNGAVKILKANKLVGVNQHIQSRWKKINSREFARAISRKELVTN